MDERLTEQGKHLIVNDAIISEGAELYHSRNDRFLSSHQLGNFRKCHALYQKMVAGLITDKDRPAYLVGRAAHTLILEGPETFAKEYIIGGPINPKTEKPYGTTSQKYLDWVEENSPAQPLTDAQYEMITKMNESVRSHPQFPSLFGTGLPEGVVRYSYHGRPCQIRMDWFNPEKGIVDLKTCNSLQWMESDARRYGYIYQFAFYRYVLEAAIGERMPVYMVAVEKEEPYRAGVWRVGEDILGLAQAENEKAMDDLKKCEDTGIWDTGYEEVRSFDHL